MCVHLGKEPYIRSPPLEQRVTRGAKHLTAKACLGLCRSTGLAVGVVGSGSRSIHLRDVLLNDVSDQAPAPAVFAPQLATPFLHES